MKKKLLLCAFALLGLGVHSQVILSIEQPASIVAVHTGSSQVTYATAANSWGVSDLLIPANSVHGQVALASDLSPTADSLMCTSAAAGSLSGKIALLYRGSCDFGIKALNAQNAGAIGIIIVNNASGPVTTSPSGGTSGLSVTVPVILVTEVIGASIKNKLENAETVVVYIGTQAGHFANDLGSRQNDILVTSAQAMPVELVQNASSFPVNLGIKVRNTGNLAQTNGRVKAVIQYEGDTIFNVNSSTFNLNSGDSVWVNSFGTFSPTNYELGEYKISYIIQTSGTDNNPTNNRIETKFNITSNLYSSAKLNASGMPTADGYSRATGTPQIFETCIHLRNQNAEAISAEGLYFSANLASNLTGQTLGIKAYRWDNVFNNAADPNYSYSNIVPIASANYTFPSNLQETTVYKAFNTPVTLQNGQRYLFCVTSTNPLIYIGYDNVTKYNAALNTNQQPINLLNIDNVWYPGFTDAIVPAIGLKTFTCPATLAAPVAIGDVICPGQAATFSATGAPNAQFNWYLGSTLLQTSSTYTTPNLNTYNAYEVTQSIPGCNAVSPRTLVDLTFASPVTVSNPQEICTGGSYSINGHTYTAAGSYTDVLQSLVTGCDSIVNTTLSIVTSFNVSQNIAICQGENYQVGTSTYTTAGTYTNVLQSTQGCDSTVTTILTVRPTSASNNPRTICQGENYSIGGSTYTVSGTYTNVLQSVNGCDSTVTTVLTVRPTSASNNPQAICTGEGYSINGHTYTTAGTYTDVLQNVHGCDSTVTTVITITTTQLNLNVTQNGASLIAVQNSGTYQWIDCNNNNTPIAGATGKTYTATANGSYAVIVTACGLTATSSCVLVNHLGIAENKPDLNVHLYPNPTENYLTISVNGTNLKQLTVTDLNGKVLSQRSVSDHTAEVDVNSLSSGVYLIEIITENGKAVKHFVKK